MKKNERGSHNAEEKTERGIFLGFFNILSVGKYQKNEKATFGDFCFRKNVPQSRKYSKGVPFGPVELLRCKNTTS